ncbi:uncharacterized protein LOC120910423 [Rana temporaria]|uniref:uncharacterized protein LOC120910423 n=1 Tax=Rana temporaria TaxID=8407 RepID=UPI001AAC4A8D|nr:uncharacterized protein LOC120910423 [Rana temporaria]
MKCLVAAILCVGFILSVCDAFCVNQPPPMQKYGEKRIRGCVFGGKLHGFGSKWLTETCMDCLCHSDGSVGCCSKLNLPMKFDRDRCEYTEDKKTCTWRLVSKEDPTQDCNYEIKLTKREIPVSYSPVLGRERTLLLPRTRSASPVRALTKGNVEVGVESADVTNATQQTRLLNPEFFGAPNRKRGRHLKVSDNCVQKQLKMRQLVVVLIGASIVAVCNAVCFRQRPQEMKMGKEHKGCIYDGKTYKRGAQWKTEDCYQCSCFLDGTMQCCTTYGTPVGYDEENCEAVFDQASCSYSLVPKKDPTVECEIRSMVG